MPVEKPRIAAASTSRSSPTACRRRAATTGRCGSAGPHDRGPCRRAAPGRSGRRGRGDQRHPRRARAWPVFDRDLAGWRPARLHRRHHPGAHPHLAAVPARGARRGGHPVPTRHRHARLRHSGGPRRPRRGPRRRRRRPTKLSLVAALRSPLYGCSDVDLFTYRAGGRTWNLRARASAGAGIPPRRRGDARTSMACGASAGGSVPPMSSSASSASAGRCWLAFGDERPRRGLAPAPLPRRSGPGLRRQRRRRPAGVRRVGRAAAVRRRRGCTSRCSPRPTTTPCG